MTLDIQHEHNLPTTAGSDLRVWADEARAAAAIAHSLAPTPFVPDSLRHMEKGIEQPDRTIANVTAALLTGQELGLAPMAAMRSVDVINGTPALRALALRALVLRAGHDLWVMESNSTRCVVHGQRRGSRHIQESTWTIDRARSLELAGRPNWRKQPTAMLLARATAECARLVAPDALLGLPYVSEELDDLLGLADELPAPAPEPAKRPARRQIQRAPLASVPDEPPTENAPAPTTAPPTAPAEDEPSFDAAPDPDDPSVEPIPKEQSRRMIMGVQLKALHAGFRDIGMSERRQRLEFLTRILGREISSTNDLDVGEASHALNMIYELRAEHEAHVEDPPSIGDESESGDE